MGQYLSEPGVHRWAILGAILGPCGCSQRPVSSPATAPEYTWSSVPQDRTELHLNRTWNWHEILISFASYMGSFHPGLRVGHKKCFLAMLISGT